MGGFGNAVKYLYSQFILRDLLSFITPGALVVLTAFLILLPEPCLSQRLATLFKYSRDMHWLLYIPLLGVFYIVGFAIQCLGEILHLVYFHPNYRSCWSQTFRIFHCRKWYDNDNMWWMLIHEEAVAFHEHAKKYHKEWALQEDERLTVLMQMCINGFLSIAIAAILLGISRIPLTCLKAVLVIFVVLLPLLASLFWGHRIHVLREFTMRRAVQHLPLNDNQDSQREAKPLL
jgi:hypothetical protein